MRTVDVPDTKENTQEVQPQQDADLVQHVKDGKQSEMEAFDTATKVRE